MIRTHHASGGSNSRATATTCLVGSEKQVRNMSIDIVRRSAWSRWYLRMPLKWSAFGLVTLLVLFPDPRVLIRQQSRIRNMNAMITPDAPELAVWDADLKKRFEDERRKHAATLPADAKPVEVSRLPAWSAQRLIERFTYDKVKYAWDWDTWGSADYMPTVAEMFERAKAATDGVIHEDCDGRAVMAASLMRRFGYQADLACDMRHVWVVTREGEWMGPGRKKTIVATPQGQRVDYAGAASNLLVGWSYGVQVFPLIRELILWAAAVVLLLRKGRSWKATLFGALLMLQGLFFMRAGHMDPLHGASAWPAWLGLGHMLAGFGVLLCPRCGMGACKTAQYHTDGLVG